MNQIFIIAHAPLAHALKQCVLHVFPDSEAQVLALDVQANEAPEVTLESATILLEGASAQTDTLVLTDVLGATPSNVAQQLLQRRALLPQAGRMRALAGVNLPMLLRARSYSHLTLDEMHERALSGGAQGIMSLPWTAPQTENREPPDDSARYHHQQ